MHISGHARVTGELRRKQEALQTKKKCSDMKTNSIFLLSEVQGALFPFIQVKSDNVLYILLILIDNNMTMSKHLND